MTVYDRFLKILLAPGIPDTFDLDPRPYVKLSTGYYYLELKKRTNWFEAYEACRKMNGALVTFETQEELNAVVRYIKGNTYINNFWTSGTDYAHQGRYVWFATGQIIELDAWWPGEPNNFNDAEHCAELSFKYQVGQQSGMNDERCTLARAYICEAE
ncbi:hypothetical protein KR018_009207, partial [Drosophila ironensis]